MPQLIIIRHGQASYGADDYDQLSELGCQQADLLGRWFAECGVTPARVVTGGLKRHRQTAEHCLAALGTEHAPPREAWIEDPALDEYDNEHILHVHKPELHSPAAVREHMKTYADPLRASRELFFEAMDRWVASQAPGSYKELWSDFHGRSHDGMLRAAEGLPDDATALVFTSGGVISALVHRLLGVAPRLAFELNWTLANTGMTTVSVRKGRMRLGSLNSIGHLEHARRPGWITYR